MNSLTKLLRQCLYRCSRPSLLSNEGIMSAVNEASFIGFQLLYSSLVVRHKCLVCVVDIGLNEDQKAWCYKQEKLILISPNLAALKFTDHEGWNKWNKPYFLMFSPFQKTLWLDPDTMVVNDVICLFNVMSHGPIIIQTNEKIDKDDWFFRRMPGNIEVPDFACYPTTSVFGLDLHRDFYLVREWMWVIENIVKNSKLEASAKRLEWAALAWGLAKHNKTNIMMRNPSWNWMANEGKIVDYPEVTDLLSNVKQDFPIAHVVNWGWPPPWMAWPDRLIDIEPHLAIGCMG